MLNERWVLNWNLSKLVNIKLLQNSLTKALLAELTLKSQPRNFKPAVTKLVLPDAVGVLLLGRGLLRTSAFQE